jgi:hypothetical protein
VRSKLFFGLKSGALLCALNAALSICFASENSLDEKNRAFEGRIHVSLTRDSQTEELLYTIGTNFLRVESVAANGANPINILNRNSGELTLVFPHNRSFTRVKAVGHSGTAPELPRMPPGVGPQSESRAASTGGGPGTAMMPMPPMPVEKLELRDTNEKTNILGYACEHFQMRQRGKTLDIWATAQLPAFQPYLRSQLSGARAGTIEEQWSELLKARHLFPFLATLKLENGLERLRFEITSVTPQGIADENAALFRPPADYHEVLPLPF